MSPAEIKKRLDAVEELLDHGSQSEARREIHVLARLRRFPRPLLATLARQARLARLSEITIRLLHRHVRSARARREPASDAELIEYASALDDFGGSREAIELLSETRDHENVDVLLQLGFAYMNVWNYDDAIAVLEKLVRLPAAHEFGKLSRRVNLAEALILGPGDHARARPLLKEVLAESSTTRFRGLHRRTLLHLMQCAVLANDRREADRLLDELQAKRLIGEEDEFDSNLLLWKAALGLLGAASPAAFANLHAARARLVERRAWERVRLCDLIEARKTGDRRLFLQLYFGSLYPEFRARVLKAAGKRLKLPEQYEWVPPQKTPGFRNAERASVLDARAGALAPVRAVLKQGHALQRLLEALSEDFYKPKTLTSLHERVFAGSSYDPLTSPDRVHQLLARLRKWLRTSRLPLEVAVSGGEYRLLAAAPCRVVIHRLQVEPHRSRPPVSSNYPSHLATLRARFGAEAFGARQAAAVLKMAHRAAGNYLKAACEEQTLERIGGGPRTRYRFR